jgi:hypothetical protein
LTVCGNDEFLVVNATATTDRVCSKVTECEAGEVEGRPPSDSTDRLCVQAVAAEEDAVASAWFAAVLVVAILVALLILFVGYYRHSRSRVATFDPEKDITMSGVEMKSASSRDFWTTEEHQVELQPPPRLVPRHFRPRSRPGSGAPSTLVSPLGSPIRAFPGHVSHLSTPLPTAAHYEVNPEVRFLIFFAFVCRETTFRKPLCCSI